jgi:hypothetical protein
MPFLGAESALRRVPRHGGGRFSPKAFRQARRFPAQPSEGPWAGRPNWHDSDRVFANKVPNRYQKSTQLVPKHAVTV